LGPHGSDWLSCIVRIVLLAITISFLHTLSKRSLECTMYKQWLLVTVLFFFLSGSSSDEPKIRRLSRTCVVITVSGTNCVAVAGTKGVAVIDTGPSPLAGKTLRKTVQNLFPRQEIIACINTHPHWDHVYGNEAFKDVPIFGMAETGAIMTAALERQKKGNWPGWSRQAFIRHCLLPGEIRGRQLTLVLKEYSQRVAYRKRKT